LGGLVLVVPEESVAVDGETPTWPPDKLSAIRLGRRLVTEVPAGPGRRAFVDIIPILDQRDRLAEHEGWKRPDSQRSFRLAHWDYGEQRIVGWDYDVGARRVRVDTASGESSLLGLIAEWGLTPAQFAYPWDTEDPQ
jgi:hypothetical protein